METNYFCVHCHFYQPPRGNPFRDEPLVEPDAAPYRNWNERISAECYTPNAELGNFERISFNVGETLAAWLAVNVPETYERIIAADAHHLEAYGVGNGIAQGMHHTILPLARHDDKVTQVKWGQAVFEYRFKRPAQGFWLPEMAVDLETLSVLVDQGIQWTILTASQVEEAVTSAGPYWVELPGDRRIKVFVRDESLSNDIAFNLGNFGGAGRWAHQRLVPRRREAGPLTLIATDGETFGHHWPGEEQFLYWLLNYEARSAGYEVITLARYAEMVEPGATVTIRENTAWSCSHGLGRWATGCACTPGDSSWKGALRRALDNLRHELDGVYAEFLAGVDGVDPLALRNAYIDVVLGKVPREGFLAAQGVDVSGKRGKALFDLVEAQFYRQRMYASCAFFFPELTALSTLYGIANAAFAIKLTQEATGTDLGPGFRHDLSVVSQADPPDGPVTTGAELYDRLLSDFEA